MHSPWRRGGKPTHSTCATMPIATGDAESKPAQDSARACGLCREELCQARRPSLQDAHPTIAAMQHRGGRGENARRGPKKTQPEPGGLQATFGDCGRESARHGGRKRHAVLGVCVSSVGRGPAPPFCVPSPHAVFLMQGSSRRLGSRLTHYEARHFVARSGDRSTKQARLGTSGDLASRPERMSLCAATAACRRTPRLWSVRMPALAGPKKKNSTGPFSVEGEARCPSPARSLRNRANALSGSQPYRTTSTVLLLSFG